MSDGGFHEKMMSEAYDINSTRAAALRRDRRERIATACLAGLLACNDVDGDYETLAHASVAYADELTKALDATEPK